MRRSKSRRIRHSKKKITAGVFLLLAAMVLFVGVDDSMIIKYYEVPTDKVDQAIRIALITDLHSCYYGENQEDLIEAVRKEQPDIILFGGDIADDVIPHDNTIAVIKALGPDYPCYYVSGNHEYWSGEVEEIKQMFRDHQIPVLEGHQDRLEFGTSVIDIFGVDDPEVGSKEFHYQLETSGRQVKGAVFSVLLSHRPEYVDTYQDYRFDLVLSGHAHGGQWRIPGVLNGLLAPDQGLFPRYAGGLYASEKQTMIVSRGLAKESTRVPRIYNHRELVIVDIVPVDRN